MWERWERRCFLRQVLQVGNLLQEAEAVGDLKDAVVSILPGVDFDTLLPTLKHPHTTKSLLEKKYCVQSNHDTDGASRVNYEMPGQSLRRGKNKWTDG